jgi:EAL domain-containing protein (putative c-di-GMP-specific phosphodiesterase class I)
MNGVSTPATLDSARRDRFLAFAFAASDLLVEVFSDGRIGFAAGAFHVRFGTAPEQFAGRHLRQLFQAADHDFVDMALSATILRGRLAPLIVRLADTHGTPVVLSGLALPTANGRVCFTVGRVPRVPGPPGEAAKPVNFARMLEERVRGTDGGALSLVELRGWSETRSGMPAEAHRALQAEIAEVLARLGGPGAIAGEIADGRFGILSDAPSDLQALAGELESVLRGHPEAAGMQVASAELGLDRGGLTGVQAARALRFALARFAEGGAAATDAAGFRGGLANFIASAESRARTVRSSIAAGRFRLAYQPVVHLVTRQVHHYEALLRPIFTPGHPVQTTQDFVTFAEAVGLSEELDWAVMQQAVIAVGDSPHVSVAVNVSGLSMQSVPFRKRMLGLLGPSGGVGGRLLVELTETADIQDVASAAESVAHLRAASVSVCIDDFGAGSAAFRYLREFRVDYVKLDGAYVRGALHNAREHGFLLSMVELANFVGAKVIAETIETEPQAKLMREVGVEYGQGWLFGRPGALPGPRTPAPGVALG